jgi:CHASE2 domain-containing sensor protein
MMNLIRKHARDILVIVLLAFALQFLEYAGVFASGESKVADFYLSKAKPSNDRRRVLTIGIIEDEYSKWFNSTSPLDPLGVAQLVASLGRLKPRAVGVDILTEWNETTIKNPDLQQTLTEIRQLNKETPIVWASSAKGEVKPPSFWHWLTGHHDTIAVEPGKVLGHDVGDGETDKWGVPVFPLDHDRSVRRFPRTWSNLYDNELEYPSTFARQVAAEFCQWPGSGCRNLGDAKEVFLSYEQTPASLATDFSVGDLFECEPALPADQICRKWVPKTGARLPEDVAILLGGTFKASRDFYATPLGENTAGLLINARAVEAEMIGPRVLEASRGLSFVLDVIIGALITGIFSFTPKWLATLSRSRALGLRVVVSFALGALAIPFSYFLFTMGVLWLSWVGMLLTVLSWHVILEQFHHDKPHKQGPRIIYEETVIHQEKTTVSIG